MVYASDYKIKPKTVVNLMLKQTQVLKYNPQVMCADIATVYWWLSGKGYSQGASALSLKQVKTRLNQGSGVDKTDPKRSNVGFTSTGKLTTGNSVQQGVTLDISVQASINYQLTVWCDYLKTNDVVSEASLRKQVFFKSLNNGGAPIVIALRINSTQVTAAQANRVTCGLDGKLSALLGTVKRV